MQTGHQGKTRTGSPMSQKRPIGVAMSRAVSQQIWIGILSKGGNRLFRRVDDADGGAGGGGGSDGATHVASTISSRGGSWWGKKSPENVLGGGSGGGRGMSDISTGLAAGTTIGWRHLLHEIVLPASLSGAS